MTRRIWICPDCGYTWHRFRGLCEVGRENTAGDGFVHCPGVPMEHIAARISDAHEAYRCAECGEPFSGTWDGKGRPPSCPCCPDQGHPQRALVIPAVAS